MAAQYEERLQRDLNWIKELVGIVGSTVEEALADAVRAVLHLDKDLAAEVILGDLLVNRQTRELDRLCHAFVARHLPSAGHLRFVSSVLRMSIALERIGDYAATISRSAAQLSSEPPAVVARDIDMMGEHSRRLFHQGLKSFQTADADLARSTLGTATQMTPTFDKVFADLAKEGEKGTRPVTDLFAFLATFNRLERVIHQAKNICEETLFVVTGKLKAEKVFDILFVDERNDGASHLAEHFTRKAFPGSGKYRSAGWEPAEEVDPAYVEFGHRMGLDLDEAWPTSLESLREHLTDFDLVIGLSPDAREHVGKLPFHTTMVVWDIDTAGGPEEVYKQLAPRVRELMEKLRGEEAN